MAVPIASVVLIWNIVFNQNGFLSGFLDKFNIAGQDWMSTGWAFWILVFSYIWKNLGYNSGVKKRHHYFFGRNKR